MAEPIQFPTEIQALAAVQRARHGGDPGPLLQPSPARPVPAFPVDVLPAPVADFVTTVATSLAVPPDLVGVPVLVALGTAIGTTRGLAPKEGWREFPSLFAGVVADSGVGKSPAIKAALAPVYGRQHELAQAWQDEQHEQHQEDRKRLRPPMEHVVTTDATTEAIATMLDTSPRGLLFHRDELTGWLRAMDQYRNGRGADREFWLQVHTGSAHKVDRKLGAAVFLPRPFVAVVGGFVPGHLGQFLNPTTLDPDGFYQRLLFVMPDLLRPAVSREAVPVPVRRAYADTVHRLFGLQEPPDARDLTFNPDAADWWWAWVDKVVDEQRGLSEVLRAKWPKMVSASLRLAIILHEAWTTEETWVVARDTIERACRLTEYFMAHDKRIVGAAQMDASDRRDRRVYEWIRGRSGGRAKARDLQYNEVASIKKAGQARLVMQSLVDRGWASWDEGREAIVICDSSSDPPDNPTQGC